MCPHFRLLTPTCHSAELGTLKKTPYLFFSRRFLHIYIQPLLSLVVKCIPSDQKYWKLMIFHKNVWTDLKLSRIFPLCPCLHFSFAAELNIVPFSSLQSCAIQCSSARQFTAVMHSEKLNIPPLTFSHIKASPILHLTFCPCRNSKTDSIIVHCAIN